jgi:small subunit ribosomal protein S24e
MEIRILEERANPLLKRHELRFEVSHPTAATPTRDSVRTELANAVHAHKERVIIERMNPRFGTAVTRGEANVYDSAEAAKSTTREHILVRNGLKEKAAKGPAAPAPSGPAAEPAKGAERAGTPPAPAPSEAPTEAPPAPPAAKPAPEPKPPAKESEEPAPTASEPPKKARAHPKKE